MSPEDAPVNSNINRDGTWGRAKGGLFGFERFCEKDPAEPCVV